MHSIADLILPAVPGVDVATCAPAATPRVCVFKEMKLAGSLFETVVRDSSVTSIPDVQQHVSEQPSGLPELLFNVDTQPPTAMLVLPLFTAAGAVRGALYLASHTTANLVWLQHDLEVLLAVAGESILTVLTAGARALCPTVVCIAWVDLGA